MRNRANVREGKKENNKIIGHGDFNLMRYPLWLIIFIATIFSLSAYFPGRSAFSQGLASRQNSEEKTGKIKRIVLDNSMVILLRERNNLPLVSLFLCVSTGSAQEEKFSGCGISHFIEHMVFKGTETRQVTDVFREIESYGGTINGFTSYDYTGYTITVPVKFIAPALELLADIVTNATFKQQEFEKERQVILKEIRQGYDNPQKYAARLLWQTAYSIHPYKYPIAGEEALLNNLTREDLLKFYQDRYVANNIFLAIVGDLAIEEVTSLVKDTFKNLRRKPIATITGKSEPQQKELRQHQEKFTSGLSYSRLGFHGVSLTNADCVALDVLATILGKGKSSRLYKLICSKKRLAYNIEAFNYTPRHPGLFIISVLSEERCRQRILAFILKEIKRIKKRRVRKDELEQAKNNIVSDILFANQTIQAQARDMALNEVIAGDFRFTEKYIQKIKEVNREDILRVANKYLQKNSLNTVALISRDKSALCNTSLNNEGLTNPSECLNGASCSALSIKQASGLIAECVSKNSVETCSGIKQFSLNNGLTLLVRENSDLPLVSIVAVFKGGLRAEDEDKNGVCNLLAEMLDQGTKSKRALEIAHLVESKGARLSCFSGNNSFGLRLELLSKDLDQMLELLTDLIVNSTFPQREFNIKKERHLALLKAQEDDIFASGIKLLKSTLFQKHPYRLPIIGSADSLKKLKRKALINFYQDFCVSRNMILAIFGDVQAEETALKVEKVFAKMKSKAPAPISPPAEPKIKGIRRSVWAFPKHTSLLLLGFYGATVYEKDRFALEVICQILSQASGRLFTEIREQSALAYTLGAYQTAGLEKGYLVIYVATSPENIETVKHKLLDHVKLLKQELITTKELTQAKRTLLSKKMDNRQTNSACAMESSLDELYGLGYRHYLQYAEQINRLEPANIRECANKYLKLDNYALATVGRLEK